MLLLGPVLLGVTLAGCGTSAGGAPRDGGGGLPALHAVPDAVHGGRLVDAVGRQVTLRGVNVDALGDYWRGTRFPPTFPFGPADADVVRRAGWDAVRLVLSWSRVEPGPGRYDDAYLAQAARVVSLLAARGVYTVVDMHQDAWSATLATRPGETCAPPLQSSLGWDGAPAWATLDGGRPHCQALAREGNLAAVHAWQSFFADAPGPGGVGIQSRFCAMWRHVARRFASDAAVAGFDILNEPDAVAPGEVAGLARMDARVLTAIRAGEGDGNGFRHVVMFEPPVTFSGTGTATVVPFAHDDDVAYAPHIYTGTFPVPGQPDPAWFSRAGQYARRYGGVPVVSGEWGGRPRSRDGLDPSFYDYYQGLLDRHGFGAMFWLYQSSCGDPHEAGQAVAAGLYVVDCRNNAVVAERSGLVALLSRPYPRAVAGADAVWSFDASTHRFHLGYRPTGGADTDLAVPGASFAAGYHATVAGARVLSRPGAADLMLASCPGGHRVDVTVTPGAGVTGGTCPPVG